MNVLSQVRIGLNAGGVETITLKESITENVLDIKCENISQGHLIFVVLADFQKKSRARTRSYSDVLRIGVFSYRKTMVNVRINWTLSNRVQCLLVLLGWHSLTGYATKMSIYFLRLP